MHNNNLKHKFYKLLKKEKIDSKIYKCIYLFSI